MAFILYGLARLLFIKITGFNVVTLERWRLFLQQHCIHTAACCFVAPLGAHKQFTLYKPGRGACLFFVFLKGQCHEIFDISFFMNQLPQAPEYPTWPFRIFSKNHGDIHSSRCTTSVIDTCGKWKKISIRKVLNIMFGHLWVAKLRYRSFFFFFKLTLKCKQFDIVCYFQGLGGR